MRSKLTAERLGNEIIAKIEEMSGENVYACYQCGRCSAGCPGVEAMDLLPNQVIRLLQMGEVEEVLRSKTPWICASCFTCLSRCPKGVDLTRIMEAVRQIVLRQNIDHAKLAQLADEMMEDLPQAALVSGFRKLTG